MSGSAGLAIRVLAAIAIAGLLVTGCGAFAPSPSPVPSFAATLATPDGQVGLARANGRIALFVPNGQGGVYEMTSNPDRALGDAAVHLAALGGATGVQINSFVFGSAPAGAVTIEVSPEDVTAPIENGLFVVGLKTKDLKPQDLHWKFLQPDGTVVLAGDNIKE